MYHSDHRDAAGRGFRAANESVEFDPIRLAEGTAPFNHVVLADSYQGKRFNSPNDLVVARNGDVYFTDPPFGLAGAQKSALRELTYTGVFRLTPDNQVHLISDKLSPNGIALSPDNRALYITDSSVWMAIDLDGSGMPAAQRQFVASEKVGGSRGDGMKADSAGNIWTSGRGGIYVFSPRGEHIGFAPIAGRVSNCVFGPGPIPLREQRHTDGARPY